MAQGIPKEVPGGDKGGGEMIFTKLSPSCQIPGLNELYEQYFPGVIRGTFVEVGGNDGYSWSNTWGLAEMGWKGLYYEPDVFLASQCEAAHRKNNVKVILACVGEFDGLTKLFRGQGCTTSPLVAKNNTYFYGNSLNNFIVSKVVSLNTSLKEQGIENNFELLVIDVDGDETGVLKGLDLKLWAPKMIIIETNKSHPFEGWNFNAAGIDSLLSPFYDEVCSDHINSIYIRRKEERKTITMPSLFESKRNAILKYAGGYGCKIFVETGTGSGDMLSAVYPYFTQAYSIELSEDRYHEARARFQRAESIKLYHGDSGKVLGQILPILKAPALIFLDAHYSGPGSAHGQDETPILKELEALLFEPRFRHVILIDDLKDFTKNPAYPTPDAMKEFITGIRHDISFDILPEGGGMIRIVKAGKKFDPEKKMAQVVPVVIEGAIEPEPIAVRPTQERKDFTRGPILYGPYRNPEKKG